MILRQELKKYCGIKRTYILLLIIISLGILIFENFFNSMYQRYNYWFLNTASTHKNFKDYFNIIFNNYLFTIDYLASVLFIALYKSTEKSFYFWKILKLSKINYSNILNSRLLILVGFVIFFKIILICYLFLRQVALQPLFFEFNSTLNVFKVFIFYSLISVCIFLINFLFFSITKDNLLQFIILSTGFFIFKGHLKVSIIYDLINTTLSDIIFNFNSKCFSFLIFVFSVVLIINFIRGKYV